MKAKRLLANALALLIMLAFIPLNLIVKASPDGLSDLELQENASGKNEYGNIEGDYNTPGSVILGKTATPVEGSSDEWDVTLSLYGKPITKKSDIILVIDVSGSMDYAITCGVTAHSHTDSCYTITYKDSLHTHTGSCLTCHYTQHSHSMSECGAGAWRCPVGYAHTHSDANGCYKDTEHKSHTSGCVVSKVLDKCSQTEHVHTSVCNTRLGVTKTAAKGFVDKLLTDGSYDRIGVVAFSDKVEGYMDLSSNADELKAYIDSLTAEGGTNIQAGLNKARGMLTGDSGNNEYIVMLGDGAATYAHTLKAPDALPCKTDSNGNHTGWYSSNATITLPLTSDAIDYSNTADNGSGNTDNVLDNPSKTYAAKTACEHGNVYSSYSSVKYTFKYTYNGADVKESTMAILEAGLAKDAGISIYSVGLDIDDTSANDTLKSIASSAGNFTSAKNGAQLDSFYAAVAGAVKKAGTNAVIKDMIGDKFDLEGSVLSYTVFPESSIVTISDDKRYITWELGDIPGDEANKATLTYRVKMKANANDELHNTNNYAYVDYDNANGEDALKFFPYPRVARAKGSILMHYLLCDEEGNLLTAENGTKTEVYDQAYRLDNPERYTEAGTDRLLPGVYTVTAKEIQGYARFNPSEDATVTAGATTNVYFKYYKFEPQDVTLNVKHVLEGGDEIKLEPPVTVSPGDEVTVSKLPLDQASGYHIHNNQLYKYQYVIGITEPGTFRLENDLSVTLVYTEVFKVEEIYLEEGTDSPEIFTRKTGYVDSGSDYTVAVPNGNAMWGYVGSHYGSAIDGQMTSPVDIENITANIEVKHYFNKLTYSAVVYYVDIQHKDETDEFKMEQGNYLGYTSAGVLYAEGGLDAYNLPVPEKYGYYELAECAERNNATGKIEGTVPPSKVFFAYYKLNNYTATLNFTDTSGNELTDDTRGSSDSSSGSNGGNWSIGVPKTLTVEGKVWKLVSSSVDTGSYGSIGEAFTGTFDGANSSATAVYKLDTFTITIYYEDKDGNTLKEPTSSDLRGGEEYTLPQEPYIEDEHGNWFKYVENDSDPATEPGEGYIVNEDVDITYTYEPYTPNQKSGTITVEYYSGDILLGSDAAIPYEYDFDNVVPGKHTVTPKGTYPFENKNYVYNGTFEVSSGYEFLTEIPVEGDVIVKLYYNLNTFNLTVHYEDESGSKIQDSVGPTAFENGAEYGVTMSDKLTGQYDGRPYELVGLKAGSDAASGVFEGRDIVVTLVYRPVLHTVTTKYVYVDDDGVPQPIISDDFEEGFHRVTQDAGTDYGANYIGLIADKNGVIWECTVSPADADYYYIYNGTNLQKDEEFTLVYKKKTVKLIVNYYVDGTKDKLRDSFEEATLASGQAVTVDVPETLLRTENMNGEDVEFRYTFKSKDDAIGADNKVTVYGDMELNVYYTKIDKTRYEYTINHYFEYLKDSATGETAYPENADIAQSGVLWLEAGQTRNITAIDQSGSGETHAMRPDQNLVLTVPGEGGNVLNVYYDLHRYSLVVNYLEQLESGIGGPLQEPAADDNGGKQYVVGQLYDLSTLRDDSITTGGIKYKNVGGETLTGSLDADKLSFDLYYKADEYSYVVKYYFDDDFGFATNGTAKVGVEVGFTDQSNYNGGDYKFVGTSLDGKVINSDGPLLKITENIATNTLYVYYVSKTYSVTVNYIAEEPVPDENVTRRITLKDSYNGGSDYKKGAPYDVLAAFADEFKELQHEDVTYYRKGVAEDYALTGEIQGDTVIDIFYVRHYKVVVNYIAEKTEPDPNDPEKEITTRIVLKDPYENGKGYEKGEKYDVSEAFADEDYELAKDGRTYYRQGDKDIYELMGTIEGDTVIDILYKEREYNYIIEYYYNGNIDNDRTKPGQGFLGDPIVPDIEGNLKSGYRYSKVEGDLAIRELEDGEEIQVVKVYYVTKSDPYYPTYYTLRVNYVDEETGAQIRNSDTSTKEAGAYYEVSAPKIEGYVYTGRHEGDALKGNYIKELVITFYYTKEDVSSIEEPKDPGTDPGEDIEIPDDGDIPLDPAPPVVVDPALPPEEIVIDDEDDIPLDDLPYTGGVPVAGMAALAGLSLLGTGALLGKKKKPD